MRTLPTFIFRPLLTQHSLALAAASFRWLSEFLQTGPSAASILANFKPPFRCTRVRQSSRGTSRLLLLRQMQKVYFIFEKARGLIDED